ncbi:MAG: hypothetical protein ACR2P4_08900 [Gammaproteobacteria bacterium]
MKKITICIIALLLSAPAAAGWKEDSLNELFAVMRDTDKAIKAQGLDADSQFAVANVVFTSVSGICIGYAGENGVSVPEPTIGEILRAHKMILQGKTPKTKTLHNIGKLCLDYMESTLHKKGTDNEAIKVIGEETVKNLIFVLGVMSKP